MWTRRPVLWLKLPKHDVADNLRRADAACLEGLRICGQLQDEAILPIHLRLPNEARASKHAWRGQRIQALE
jgi:hypothetical protein